MRGHEKATGQNPVTVDDNTLKCFVHEMDKCCITCIPYKNSSVLVTFKFTVLSECFLMYNNHKCTIFKKTVHFHDFMYGFFRWCKYRSMN